MNIFSICSYYPGSPLYRNLFESLDNSVSQFIYVPYQKNRAKLFTNRFLPRLKNGNITYKPIWENYNRILYKNKISKAIRDIDENEIKKSDIIHAHTWFSDGGIAFEINRVTNKPYIIAIRNTDVNIFYKNRLDLRKYSHKILLNSSKIVLISPSYRTILELLLPDKVFSKIVNKFVVIPNGIDSFWFNNIPQKSIIRKKKNFIYVGDIRSNKNIDILIKSFIKISYSSEVGKLKLVGFRNETKYEQTIKEKFSSFPNIEFYGRKTKEELKNLYRDSDIFIMISKKETFGLVYIEALSQGLPIIYSKGQGVDGYFDKTKVGENVNNKSIVDISRAMMEIVLNYFEYQKNTIAESMNFNWNLVGLEYLKLYKKIS